MTHYWFISTKYRHNATLALVAFGLAFFVIMLGAFTRLTNAGLSCPDWPHCYGYLTAPHTMQQLEGAIARYPLAPVDIKKAWTEMTHRYFAGAESLLIVTLAFTFLFGRKARDVKSTTIALTLLALLSTQILLGMLTVTEKLRPVIVLGHLLTGISILSVLWWAYLDLHLYENFFRQKTSPRVLPWLWLGFFLVAAQITLGGWVSTHYAGLACIDFPYCNGKILPTLQWQQLNSDLITIHMLHRIGALITGTYLLLLSFFLLRQPSFRAMAILIVGVVSLQITLGILNIIWLRPVWVALIHHMVAIFLFLTMITSLVKAHYETRDTRYGSWIA